MISITYDDLKALNPCPDKMQSVTKLMGGAKAWGRTRIDAAEARKRGASFDDIVWTASAVARSNPDVERRLRLWLADCSARVLHIFEKEYPADTRVRDCIIAGRAFTRGQITDAARASARAAARDAARAAAWDAAWDAAWAAARATAWDAARAAAWDAARDAARAAEELWQFDRLILWLSDEEPQDWPLPERGAK